MTSDLFCMQVTKIAADPDMTVRFTGLEGGTNYNIEAVTRSGSQTSAAKSITIRTGKNNACKLI